MESPVRICLGAAIVVSLLLVCNAPVEGLAIPNDIITTTEKNEVTKFKLNITRTGRDKPKTPDVALNELSAKEPAEDHTDKNAKYKDRGRVRYGERKSTTVPPKRKSTSPTDAVTLVIVTPTPEVKKPAQIINSMRNYKKTKMSVSSTSPVPTSSEESDEKEDSYEKFTSSKYLDNHFSIPNFEDDHSYEIDNDNSNNKVKKDSKSSYEFPNYSKEDSYNFKPDKEPFKSSFFDFNSKLTTPKNDFFDKRYENISSSIKKNLDHIKSKSPPPNVTNVHKIVHENVGLERLNNTPSNKSSIYFKNTKEIRLSDNEGAGTANKEFSDVQGTSVYYEMSVLSTNTYTMDHSHEDDCDENTETTTEPTNDSITKVKTTQPTLDETIPTISETKPTINNKLTDSQPISASNFISVSTIAPFFNPSAPFSYSTISYSLDDRITKLFPNRSRSYSKRLNLNGIKESPNSVTPKPEATYTLRPHLRSKFRSTTSRTRPVWMAPKRNSTRVYTSTPRTVYSEHFSVRERPTLKPLLPSRTVLTTISSAEIDPVFQTDSSGTSKVVNSQFVTDNSIPSLRKRGSTRFKGSTPSSAEVDSGLAELEMPSTAWALASLISPPSLPTNVVNATENELQKVGEIIDKKETTPSSTTTSTVSSISNDIITKKVTDVEQNKLPWHALFTPTASINENKNTINFENKISTENKETLPAESIISIQSSAEPATTESTKENTLDAEIKSTDVKVEPLKLPATIETVTTTDKNEITNVTKSETVQPIDATRSTGFESITKLPADVTTPQDETVTSSEVTQTITEKIKATTDYEITTIRFSYGTTEAPEEDTEDTTNTIPIETSTKFTRKYVIPTRTKATTIEDLPITTYRPPHVFSTDVEETTTILPDTTPTLEVSSQVIANSTEQTPEMTESSEQTELTTEPIEEMTTETIPITSSAPTTTIKQTTMPEPTQTTYIPEETTTTVVHVVTEINTEKSTIITPSPSTTAITSSEETGTSEENSHSNEITYDVKTEISSDKPEVTTVKPKTTHATTTVEDNLSYKEATTLIQPTEDVSKYGSEEDLNEATTEASGRGPEEAGSGAAIAIAVSTIGVIALVLLIGLLLVVRRRGRRGVYAQRCTPVSLDAYSLDSVSVGHRKGNTRLRASKRSYGNPAYDDEVTSHPMQYPALASFALDVESMCAEFAEIPNVTVKGEEVPPGCEDKNRYSNVLPLPETRVPLQRINNDPTTEYINANFVTGPGNIRNYYILAQAPLSNTVVDFWRMIWEQNSRLIVMLTEYMENGVEKCYEYLPPSEVSDNKRSFGDFTIILKKREQRDKYAVSTIHLVNLASRTWREVTHLWYFWPAKGVPEDYDSVIDFLFEMRSYMKVAQTAKEYDEEGVEVIYGDLNRSSFNNLSKLRDESGSGNGVNVYSPARAEEHVRRANNGTLSRMKAASEVESIRPCVVTCASGAGRSGALAALDVCARALAAAPARADVPRAVRTLRTMRPAALPNRHHYVWLYKVLSEYGNKMMGAADNI